MKLRLDVEGLSRSDLLDAIDAARISVENEMVLGMDRNESSSYHFSVEGEGVWIDDEGQERDDDGNLTQRGKAARAAETVAGIRATLSVQDADVFQSTAGGYLIDCGETIIGVDADGDTMESSPITWSTGWTA